MIYDTKNRILHTGVHEETKLSPREHELLICLSSGKLATYEEICQYMKITEVNFKSLKSRFIDKLEYKLHIKMVRNVGMILEDEIYFEWGGSIWR